MQQSSKLASEGFLFMETLINQIVLHKKFGRGTIINFDGKILEVSFEQHKEIVKKFSYPASFNGFLSFENESLQKKIEVLVSNWKVESGVAQQEAFQKQYQATQKEINERRKQAEQRRIEAAKANRRLQLERKNMETSYI